jgi:hypothetical protein
MADCYTKFCLVIDEVTDEEYAWLKANANWAPTEGSEEEAPPWWDEEGECVPFDTSWYLADREFAVESEEQGSPSAAAEFLSAFLAKFRPETTLGLEWACVTEPMRADGYGGGAAFITATVVQYMNTTHWLLAREEEHRAQSESMKGS